MARLGQLPIIRCGRRRFVVPKAALMKMLEGINERHKKGKNNKKKSPSRERYERKCPIFSFWIYEELKERIKDVKKAENVSNTNIMEAGVGLFENEVLECYSI